MEQRESVIRKIEFNIHSALVPFLSFLSSSSPLSITMQGIGEAAMEVLSMAKAKVVLQVGVPWISISIA